MTLPNLQGAELLALDIETHDPDLLDLGPGPRRGDGRILGVGVADGKQSWYIPVSHPASENVALEYVVAWLNDMKPKAIVGANLLYDLDWLTHHGYRPDGSRLLDVQLAEPLLDENRKYYNLDSLGKKYFGTGKNEEELDYYCMMNGWKGKPQQHLHKMPADLVAPYCKNDCELTFDVLQAQMPELAKQDLLDLFDLECGLLPLLLRMRQVGVRFNAGRLAELREEYTFQRDTLAAELRAMVGFEVNVDAARSIRDAFMSLSLPFEMTDKGNPSFSEAALNAADHDVARKILSVRHYNTLLGTFVEGLSKHVLNDRIHCQFHPLRGDEYGTVSGRFSSSNPNLQQIPARDGQSKKDLRGLFVPEDGCRWLKLDYSQIELRILAHFGRGTGAEEMRAAYQKNPDMDFHQFCADLINGHLPEEKKIKRGTAKSINFGVVYGMGKAKMATDLGLTDSAAALLMGQYYAALPFLRQTGNEAKNVAERRGYIKTLLNRRRRFIDKRWTYKALNALIQGSAADVMKKAMVDAWRSGVFDVLVPHLTVHDELDCSVPEGKAGDEAVAELKRICENTIPLRVPLVAECELMETWAG